MVVNHNIAAICESRQLRYNVKKMEKSSKKLATGYKLNTANDDAAGLQISETMRHHVKGLNKASRNSQDGISMLQTADAALQETQDVLDRMVELTTQAANDINTDSDRRAIQDELDQLNKEVSECLNTGKNRNSRRPALSGVVTAFTPDPSVLGIVGVKNSLKSRWRS